MICYKCQANNSDDSKFCIKCGAKLEAKNICHNCQLENDLDARFCKMCGTNLKDTEFVSLNVKIKKNEQKETPEIDLNVPSTYERIIKIFSIISFAIFIVILITNFALSFTSYYEFYGGTNGVNVDSLVVENMNYSYVFKYLSDYENISVNDIYFKYANFFPIVMSLIGMLIASIGTFVFLILAVIFSLNDILYKKKIKNLSKYLINSIMVLTLGVVIVGIFAQIDLRYVSDKSIKGYVELNLSSSKLFAICLSFVWLGFDCLFKSIINLVFKKMKIKSFMTSILNLASNTLLLTLLIMLAGTFINYKIVDTYDISNNCFIGNYSIGSWFSYISELSYENTKSLIYKNMYLGPGWTASFVLMLVYTISAVGIYTISLLINIKDKKRILYLILGVFTCLIGIIFLTTNYISYPPISDIHHPANDIIRNIYMIDFTNLPIKFIVVSVIYLVIQIVNFILDVINNKGEKHEMLEV